MTTLAGFAFGLIGGGALEFLEVARVSRLDPDVRRRSTRDMLFWFVRVGSTLIGGAFGYAYVASTKHPIVFSALTLGAAWPTIVGRAQSLAGIQVDSK